MKIALSTDHAGYEGMKKLKEYLHSVGHECVDFGPVSFDVEDDYPDFIFPAAQAVATGECERGIIFGGSGQGEAMAANRVRGARCTVYYAPVQANGAINAEGEVSSDPYILLRLSREHNGANMLSLGARFMSFDEIKKVSDAWLQYPDADAERHLRRIAKLDQSV